MENNKFSFEFLKNISKKVIVPIFVIGIIAFFVLCLNIKGFFNPDFLWASLLVIVPILIHFINLRKVKTLYFSDLRFLMNLEKKERKQKRIKELLLLFSRIFLILSLVFAFAFPFSGKEKNLNNLGVNDYLPIIWIDNSYSMQMGKTSITNLERAKNKAIEIIKSYPLDQKFLLVTNDFFANELSLYSSEPLIDLIMGIKSTFNAPNFDKIIDKTLANLNILNVAQNIKKEFYVLSDYQTNVFDFDNLSLKDSLLDIKLIELNQTKFDNVFVDTIEISSKIYRPNSLVDLRAKIVNNSNKDYNDYNVNLLIDNRKESSQKIYLKAHQGKYVDFRFVNPNLKIVSGQVNISDMPVTFDNSLSFEIKNDSLINVAYLANPKTDFIFKSLFEKDDDFLVHKINSSSINSDFLDNCSTLFLSGLDNLTVEQISCLHTFVSKGGNLCILPSKNANIASYNNLLKRLMLSEIKSLDTSNANITKIEGNHYIFNKSIQKIPENPALPKVKAYFKTDNYMVNQDNLLKASGDRILTSISNYGMGKVLMFYFMIDKQNSNFYNSRLIVPLFYNFATLKSINESFKIVDYQSRKESNAEFFNQKYVKITLQEKGFNVSSFDSGNIANQIESQNISQKRLMRNLFLLLALVWIIIEAMVSKKN